MNKHFFIILVVSNIIPLSQCQTLPPFVCNQDQSSCYMGAWNITDRSSIYASFQGIKYATAPTGELRFKSPQKYAPTQETIDVSHKSTIACTQLSEDYMTGR